MLAAVREDRTALTGAMRRAAFSILVNIILSTTKAVAGVAAGSTALLSDAANSASDVFTSSAAFFGLWLAGRKHPSFPYGLHKAETLAALLIALVIIIVAYEIGKTAILRPSALPDTDIGIPVALGTCVASLVFGLYQLRAGRRLHSPAIVANAKDYLADSLASGVVLTGFIGNRIGYDLERFAALIVGVFVMKAGLELLVTTVKDLLDASIDRETERKIIASVEAHPRVEKVARFLSRTAGGRYIVDIDATLKTPSHEVADRVSDALEQEIVERFPLVIMARVRPHYARSTLIKRITPVNSPEGGQSEHLAKAPWFLVEIRDGETGATVQREFLENPHGSAERKRGYLVGTWLMTLKPDEIVVQDGRDGTAAALLRDAGVRIIQAAKKEGAL